MSFFQAFWGTCCGTEVFRKLCKNFWLKTLWHLILMCFVCSVFIGIGNYYSMKYRWRAAEAGFVEGFGGKLHLNRMGVRPDISPEVSRRQEFPYNCLLIYISPNGAEKNYPDETLRDRNVILMWHHAFFAFAIREGQQWVYLKWNPEKDIEMPIDSLSFNEMRNRLLKDAYSKNPGEWKWNEESFTTEYLFKQFRLMFAQVQAICHFFFIFIILLCSLVFSVFFRLVSAKKIPDLSFGMIWNVVIYAAFPVLLVVSAFPALQLPGTHWFLQMFMIGWMVYLFFILRTLIFYSADEDMKKEEGTDDE